MALREGRDADAEVAHRRDQLDQFAPRSSAPRGAPIQSACGSAPGGSPRSASRLRTPGGGQPADHVPQLGDAVVDGGQVRQRRHRGLGGDPLGDRDRALAGRPAGAVGDRHERRAAAAPARAAPSTAAPRPRASSSGRTRTTTSGRPAASSSRTVPAHGIPRVRAPRPGDRRRPDRAGPAPGLVDTGSVTAGTQERDPSPAAAGARPAARRRLRRRSTDFLDAAARHPRRDGPQPGPGRRRGPRPRRGRQAAAAGVRLLGLARRLRRRPARTRPRCSGPSPRWSSCTPAPWSTTTSWTARRPGAAARPPTSGSPPGTAATALTGDGDAFGTGAAILVGDLALVWSDELLGRSGPLARSR